LGYFQLLDLSKSSLYFFISSAILKPFIPDLPENASEEQLLPFFEANLPLVISMVVIPMVLFSWVIGLAILVTREAHQFTTWRAFVVVIISGVLTLAVSGIIGEIFKLFGLQSGTTLF